MFRGLRHNMFYKTAQEVAVRFYHYISVLCKTCFDSVSPWLHRVTCKMWAKLPQVTGTSLSSSQRRWISEKAPISLLDVPVKVFGVILFKGFHSDRDQRTQPNQRDMGPCREARAKKASFVLWRCKDWVGTKQGPLETGCCVLFKTPATFRLPINQNGRIVEDALLMENCISAECVRFIIRRHKRCGSAAKNAIRTRLIAHGSNSFPTHWQTTMNYTRVWGATILRIAMKRFHYLLIINSYTRFCTAYRALERLYPHYWTEQLAT